MFDLIHTGSDQKDENFADSWMKKIILPQADVFQNLYDQLTNSQRATLQAMAGSTEPGIYSEEVRIKYGLPVSSSLSEALKSLQKKGFIYRTAENYEIANPVFREWLLTLK